MILYDVIENESLYIILLKMMIKNWLSANIIKTFYKQENMCNGFKNDNNSC